MPGFGEIFEEWERLNSDAEKAARKRAQKPGPGKLANPRRVAEAEAEAEREAAERAARDAARKGGPAVPARASGGKGAARDPNAVMAAWLRRHGAPKALERETLDEDAAGLEPGAPAAPGRGGRRAGPSADRDGAGEGDANVLLSEWLDRYGAPAAREASERDAPSSGGRASGPSQRELEALPVDASVDLHGLRAAEAEERLEAFLRDSAATGARKVLVVHGKCNHSPDEPVLKAVARRVLERSPHAGRSGPAPKSQGGSGATWVLLRPSSRKH
ncbi:MAG: Smr/MutS family protein [Spirochaetia bacterium]|nr:Smr/MutS family protein [Spirochaetia bacterium]